MISDNTIVDRYELISMLIEVCFLLYNLTVVKQADQAFAYKKI